MIFSEDKNNIWTVSQLSNYIKEVFDTDPNLKQVMVKGEISNFHHHSSGHMYFTLKDKNSQLSAVMFKGHNQSLEFNPDEGMSVIVTGRVSLYTVRGEYQIYINQMQPDGIGSLYKAYEQLKDRLDKEGLFKEEFKRDISNFPAKVGVITSATGAAIRDIISVIKRRSSNVSLLIAPATVQGDAAEATLINALELLNQSDVDVIIIGRGGGSIEDLWGFNKERVARAIFNSSIPVISAVGHETDFTIADFVADLRAPTPSAAAELVVSNQADLKRYLKVLYDNLINQLDNKLSSSRETLDNLGKRRAFTLLESQLLEYKQELDELNSKLEDCFKSNLERRGDKLQHLVSQLNSLSPLNTFARGYALARRQQQNVSSVEDVIEGDLIEVLLKDGELTCQIRDIKEKELLGEK